MQLLLGSAGLSNLSDCSIKRQEQEEGRIHARALRPVLDRKIGKVGSSIMRADGISWQFGRGHAGPEIS